MDYIQYAIEQLERNNHGISAGRARDQYAELKARLAQLEAVEQQRAVDVAGLPHEGVPCKHCGQNPYTVGLGMCPARN